MITAITSGGSHERAVQFYFHSDPFATAQWTSRLDHGRERSSVTATQACLELGGDQGGDGQALAQGRQKHRWWTGLALACGGVWDVLQEFRITKMFAADERRHAAIPKTVAMIRFWAMISPLLVLRSCPLRIMCITSKPLRVLQAVRKEPNPKQYLARLLTNR